MFDQLIKKYFEGNQILKKAEKTIKKDWADWLNPISLDNPVGNDLTYHDSFQDIKEEINKLSNIDYEKIIRNSEKILKEDSKDLRVATYYCFARLQLDGIEGLAEGLELLAGLLLLFDKDLYPSRMNVKKNSIEWLTNSKFTDSLTDLFVSKQIFMKILSAMAIMQDACKSIFIDPVTESVTLPDLDALLKLLHSASEKSSSSVYQIDKIKTQVNNQKIEVSKEEVLENSHIKIDSHRNFLNQGRLMAKYLKKETEGYLSAGRLVRVIRWDTVSELPPAKNDKTTKIIAPRKEIQSHLSSLYSEKQWQALFEASENAFLESANHLWFDLQRMSIVALQNLNIHSQFVSALIADLSYTLSRLEGIENYLFDNGMPFASAETLDWITTMVTKPQLSLEDNQLNLQMFTDIIDWETLEKEAYKVSEEKNLQEAFLWLQNHPQIHAVKHQCFIRFIQAKLAESQGNIDIALNLLSDLDQQLSSTYVVNWEDDLAFDIKRQLLKILKIRYQLVDSNKVQISSQIESLQYQLMNINPAKALSIL